MERQAYFILISSSWLSQLSTRASFNRRDKRNLVTLLRQRESIEIENEENRLVKQKKITQLTVISRKQIST